MGSRPSAPSSSLMHPHEPRFIMGLVVWPLLKLTWKVCGGIEGLGIVAEASPGGKLGRKSSSSESISLLLLLLPDRIACGTAVSELCAPCTHDTAFANAIFIFTAEGSALTRGQHLSVSHACA